MYKVLEQLCVMTSDTSWKWSTYAERGTFETEDEALAHVEELRRKCPIGYTHFNVYLA